MPLTTSTVIPQPIADFYNRVTLERALPFLAHNMFGQKKPVPKKSGEHPLFRRYGSLTASTAPLTEGITPAASVLSYTDIRGQLRQYGNHIEVTDFVELTSQDRVLTEGAEILGENAGDSLDQIYRDKLVAGTSVYLAGAVALRANIDTLLTAGELNIILRAMRRNNAKYWMENPIVGQDRFATTPIAAAYFGIAHPDQLFNYESVLTTAYTLVHQYASPEQRLPNEHGAYKSLRMIESTNAKFWPDAGGAIGGLPTGKSTGGVNLDVYASLFFGQNAYGVTDLSGEGLKNIYKAFGSGGTSDPYDQRATQAWKATTDLVILNDAFMYRYETAVSA